MKNIKFYCFLILIVSAIITSCDPYTIGDPSVYWNSNTLNRLQLKDNVKRVTWTVGNGNQVYDFNSTGFVIFSAYTDGALSINEVYNYELNGRLLSIVRITTGGTEDVITKTFQYQNTGKYVVQNKNSLLIDALVPNLKKIMNGLTQTVYQDNGKNIKIIEMNGSYNDTTLVEYVGNFPESITLSNGTVYTDFTFDTYGKFKTYTKTYKNTTCSNECKYYFKTNDQYLMLDSMVQRNIQDSYIQIDKDKYSYNSNMDLATLSNSLGNYRYTYTYDSYHNWITKMTDFKSIGTEDWGLSSQESREITYW
ncbi:MAG: hypothetical protein PHS59_14255 [Paludibacter sp.]|nr:hypothetical protein [Paludibacter sp.]